MPLWKPGPVGRRDVVFILLVAAAVLPTLSAAAAPLRAPARLTFARAIAALRRPWRL
jgi:hypothetical protein